MESAVLLHSCLSKVCRRAVGENRGLYCVSAMYASQQGFGILELVPHNKHSVV